MLLITLFLRILSNPLANVLQKELTKQYSTFFVNAITYGGLFILMLPFIFNLSLNPQILFYGLLGGLLGALGNAFLIKALSIGDLSVLGPINSYKPVVAMFLGIFILKELPSMFCVLAVLLIILGSYFIFDTIEEKFSFKLFLRKDIQYRFYALFLTAVEALIIKQIIILSNIKTAFIFWCMFGFIFSVIFLFIRKEKISILHKKSNLLFLFLILLFGLMQITTNYIFNNMNVSYALALFQLSTIINVIFGYKFFKEKHIVRKLIGTIIMIIGATIIILD